MANFHVVNVAWLVSRNAVPQVASRTSLAPESRKLPGPGSRQPSSSKMLMGCSQLFWLRGYTDLSSKMLMGCSQLFWLRGYTDLSGKETVRTGIFLAWVFLFYTLTTVPVLLTVPDPCK